MSSSKFQAVLLNSDDKAARWISKSNYDFQLEPNLFSWQRAVHNGYGNVGILELKSTFANAEIQKRLELAYNIDKNAVKQEVLLAVTDAELSQFKNQLLISGFAGVFCSHSEMIRFCRMLENHESRVRIPDQGLEASILNKLPWNSDSKEFLDD